MNDVLDQYKGKLDRQLMQLGIEGLVFQRRLLENLARARLYGDTETSRAERAQLLDALNHLSLETAGKPFSELFPTKFGNFVRDDKGFITFVDREPIIVGDSNLAQQVLGTTRESDEEAGDNLHQVIKLYKQAIITARELGDRQDEAMYQQELGVALLRLDDFDHAAEVLQKAINLFETVKAAPLLRARTRYHLGRCYHRSGRWREATTLLEQSRETFSRYKSRPELAHALLELGQLYHQRQDFESAYIYLKDALRLFRRLKDTDGIAVTQEALGSLALQTACPSEAVTSLQEARRGYTALRRTERIRAVDDLLHIAHQSRQPVGGAAL